MSQARYIDVRLPEGIPCYTMLPSTERQCGTDAYIAPSTVSSSLQLCGRMIVLHGLQRVFKMTNYHGVGADSG